MYIEKTINEYLHDLAARMPAPGGGSCAALTGAMASALISMVLNFTVGNDKYEDFQEAAKGMLSASEGIRKKFIKLFEDDVKSYDLVSKAYKMPRDTSSATVKRKRAVKEALKEASIVPLNVCRLTIDAIRLCPALAKGANKKLICDVEVALRLLESAFYSAKINIVMNQRGIDDEEFNKDVTRQLAELEKELLSQRDSSQKEIAKLIGR